MDDIIGPIVVTLLIAAVGWLLSIIGFFRANRAITELQQLRATIAVPGRCS